jgi:hypothetical protein
VLAEDLLSRTPVPRIFSDGPAMSGRYLVSGNTALVSDDEDLRGLRSSAGGDPQCESTSLSPL